MKVIVQHVNQDRKTLEITGFTDVAEVNVPYEGNDVNVALNYAYRWTNNVSGSWSIKIKEMTLSDGTTFENGDYNDDVTVLAPLHKNKVGLRSTSLVDRMIVNGKTYKVSMFGFEEIK